MNNPIYVDAFCKNKGGPGKNLNVRTLFNYGSLKLLF